MPSSFVDAVTELEARGPAVVWAPPIAVPTGGVQSSVVEVVTELETR